MISKAAVLLRLNSIRRELVSDAADLVMSVVIVQDLLRTSGEVT